LFFSGFIRSRDDGFNQFESLDATAFLGHLPKAARQDALPKGAFQEVFGIPCEIFTLDLLLVRFLG
jgi:hypothetical protein